jgi:hypothetical protein
MGVWHHSKTMSVMTVHLFLVSVLIRPVYSSDLLYGYWSASREDNAIAATEASLATLQEKDYVFIRHCSYVSKRGFFCGVINFVERQC